VVEQSREGGEGAGTRAPGSDMAGVSATNSSPAGGGQDDGGATIASVRPTITAPSALHGRYLPVKGNPHGTAAAASSRQPPTRASFPLPPASRSRTTWCSCGGMWGCCHAHEGVAAMVTDGRGVYSRRPCFCAAAALAARQSPSVPPYFLLHLVE